MSVNIIKVDILEKKKTGRLKIGKKNLMSFLLYKPWVIKFTY